MMSVTRNTTHSLAPVPAVCPSPSLAVRNAAEITVGGHAGQRGIALECRRRSRPSILRLPPRRQACRPDRASAPSRSPWCAAGWRSGPRAICASTWSLTSSRLRSRDGRDAENVVPDITAVECDRIVVDADIAGKGLRDDIEAVGNAGRELAVGKAAGAIDRVDGDGGQVPASAPLRPRSRHRRARLPSCRADRRPTCARVRWRFPSSDLPQRFHRTPRPRARSCRS